MRSGVRIVSRIRAVASLVSCLTVDDALVAQATGKYAIFTLRTC